MNFNDLLTDLAIETNALIRAAASSMNLSVSQAYHLFLIPFGGIPMSSLAKKLGLDASTLTRNISNLEGRKLIMRKPDIKDRRIHLIFLTNQGRSILKSIEEYIEEENYNLLTMIDLDTQENLITILEKLSWAFTCKKN